MENILYEIGVRFDPLMIIPVILAAVILSAPLILEKICKKQLINLNIRLINIISVSLTLIIITVTTVFAISSVREYKALMDAYQSGEYLTVTGYVENFTPMQNKGNGEESFTIDGIYFSYESGFDYGYNEPSAEGGVITGNGQYLKIGYVEYGGVNKIVYIEEPSRE